MLKARFLRCSLVTAGLPSVPVQALEFSALGACEHTPSSPLSVAGAQSFFCHQYD